ncbi:Scr1 family TA system antitoxin-like transcriptional regulator [Sphaerimonospora sp. CA-214678]|uniref:Scr1 family TA system antitoxin-like transcriptional regulator n=1 Tax=Sphaerimonospora sp. CA-214678 TaxID=3240029 RepID=UPI003D9039DF
MARAAWAATAILREASGVVVGTRLRRPRPNAAFEILDFSEPSHPDVVFLENLTGSLYIEQEADVCRYTVMFDHLRAKTLDPDTSRRLLADVIAGLSQ